MLTFKFKVSYLNFEGNVLKYALLQMINVPIVLSLNIDVKIRDVVGLQ